MPGTASFATSWRNSSGPPPEGGRPAEEVLEQVVQNVLPYAARLDHPRFFGFVPSSPTWPGIVADFLAAGFNINSCTWLVSSGTSQLELVVVDWMRHWIGYPDTAGGLLTSGGSAASVEALVAARDAAGHPSQPTVYMSDEATLERINREVLARAFWDELAFFSSTSLKGVFSLRLCIVNHTTTWEDVSRTLDRVVQLGEDALAGS